MRFTPLTSYLNYKSVLKTSWDQSSQTNTQHTNTTSGDSSTSISSSSLNTSLVRIKWIDACSHGGPGWVDLEDAIEFASEPCPVMETVGHIIYEVNDPRSGYVVMTDTLGVDECSAVHKIPYVMIIERLPL